MEFTVILRKKKRLTQMEVGRGSGGFGEKPQRAATDQQEL
jgi:hypothetical protein